MFDSYYDHHPDLPDDYWDEVDYKFGTERQRKLDAMEPDGDPYEERKLKEREEETC